MKKIRATREELRECLRNAVARVISESCKEKPSQADKK